MTPRSLLFAVLIGAAMTAAAAQVPQPSPVDPRIRTIVYNPREVVTITGQLGYQMVVAFGDGERIENISIGDGQAWQVTPNRKADLLFLKPIDRLPSTNMTVVTNLRRYNFELISVPATTRRAQTYDIRFMYPNEELAAAAKPVDVPASEAPPPEGWNFAYSYTGAKTNVPARVFDDGKATFFQWVDGGEAPAVFVVGPDGKESLVNTATRGRYFVVEQVAAHFVLRNGTQVTQVFNDAAKPVEPGVGAPRERVEPKRKGGLFGSRQPQ
ncbi:MAG: P-type conjugative transfer protein VirB9 [Sandarakinorhabdus sp.]|nr:P-type conjugative transfer protein VirB9 [Sandarakinorhabdus sp.]